MRLFAAIPLTEEVRKQMIDVMHTLKQQGIRGNYTSAANLHLTLCFIGETEDKARVEAALRNVSYRPFLLKLDGMGRFGDTLYVGIKGGQAISVLAADIRKALDAEGIPYDRKPFTPHITLIRGMAGGDGTKVPAPRGEMNVKRVSLMKSVTKDGKPVYTEVARL